MTNQKLRDIADKLLASDLDFDDWEFNFLRNMSEWPNKYNPVQVLKIEQIYRRLKNE